MNTSPSGETTPRTAPTQGGHDFGRALANQRRARGWTLKAAAKRAGVVPKTWRSAENGNPARAMTIAGIEQAFNAPPGSFLDAYHGNVSLDQVFRSLRPAHRTSRAPTARRPAVSAPRGLPSPGSRRRVDQAFAHTRHLSLAEILALRDMLDVTIAERRNPNGR